MHFFQTVNLPGDPLTKHSSREYSPKMHLIDHLVVWRTPKKISEIFSALWSETALTGIIQHTAAADQCYLLLFVSEP